MTSSPKPLVQLLTTDSSLWYSVLEGLSKDEAKLYKLDRNWWVVAYRTEAMDGARNFVAAEQIVAIRPLV